jgi:hypothetical protein
MFDSRRSWSEAGFEILNRSSNGKIMVACHPTVRGLLFKKYTTSVARRDQRKNYECRVEGSRRLRALAEGRGLTRIRVPRKWIVTLPWSSREDPLLVVERLELMGSEQTVSAYRRIDEELLGQLCTVLFHFRGMDSNANNLPFLTGGRIGLVDTEHWDRGTRRGYLHHLRDHMSSDGRKIAKKIFRRLRHDDSRDGGSVAAENARRGADDGDGSSSSLSSSSSS